MIKYIKTFILAVYAISFCGCFTVSVNMSGAKIHPDAQTFTVQDFVNNADDVQPNLALEMTEALRNKVEQTRLKLINGYGDINFQGEIVTYKVESQSVTAQNVSSENRFTIGVRITYSNLLEPESDFEKVFSSYENFPGDQSIEDVREEKTKLIMENIIDDIFKEAFVNW